MNRLDGLVPVLTASEMRELERSAFSEGGIKERVVLESAGRSVAAAVAAHFPEGRVVAAVGRGNNGGDAIVALRTLRTWGREVLAIPIPGADLAAELTHGWQIPTSDDRSEFGRAGVVLDGILGTGAAGALRSPIDEVVDAINAARRPVVAIDGPTGVDLTTGEAPGSAVEAKLTVTFGAVKRGLLLYPGRRLAGRLLLAEVGFPPVAESGAGSWFVTDRWVFDRLPTIPPDAHKGSVGLVGIVAGRAGVGGAAIMAAMGALRAGCGGVRVASADANRIAIHSAVPEAVFVDRSSSELIDSIAETAAVLIGPGIGTGDEARLLLEKVLHGVRGPLLIDADALTIIARHPNIFDKAFGDRTVFTPHPGELARLLDCSTAEVLADRFAAATKAAERFGCTILSKGAPSLVAAPGHPVLVSVAGHSGVATGGMGDTLGGIVSSFLAAGAVPREGSAIGLHIAGLAAERAGRGRGLLPRDVAEAIPYVLEEGGREQPFAAPFLIDLAAAR